MLRDRINGARHGSAVHEAAHASFAWHFSQRELTNPPFSEIQVDFAPNLMGVHYGHVDVSWDSLDVDLPTRCAITLAGIYCRECPPGIGTDEWIALVEGRDGTDGTDDFADAYNLAGTDWPAIAAQALQLLQAPTAIGPLVLGIAELMDEIETLSISNPNLIQLLQGYSSTDHVGEPE